LALRAATLGAEFDTIQAEKARFGAAQVFPVKAGDLSDRLQGPELGAALKDAKTRWIASDFRLTKADLIG